MVISSLSVASTFTSYVSKVTWECESYLKLDCQSSDVYAQVSAERYRLRGLNQSDGDYVRNKVVVDTASGQWNEVIGALLLHFLKLVL